MAVAIWKKVEVLDQDGTAAAARRARQRARLPLREVARRMELSSGYLCDLELGRRHWSEELVQRFQAALADPQ